MDKRSLTERDICTKFILPALKSAGWDDMLQIREELYFTKGRIIVRGKLVSRGKAKKADFVLCYKPNIPIAIIEAKDNNHSVGDGMQQALDYATTLDIPFVFSSNGDGFVFHDRTGASAVKEANLGLDAFPSPANLWARYRAWKGLTPEGEQIVLQDYFDDGSGKAPRYYQVNAVNAAIEAIAKGKDRVLLVMATGTGKTYTAFQIIWRLWKAGRKKRILFLADRNVLIDQTMVNDFRPFGPAMAKLSTNAKTIERVDGTQVDLTLVRDVFEDAYNYIKSGQLMRQVVNKISAVDFNNLAERQHFGDIYEQILTDLQSAGNAGEYYTPRAVTAFMADRIDPRPGEILFDPACGTGGFLTCSIRHMRDRYVKKPEHEAKMQGALRAVEKKQLPHMLCVTNMLLHGIEDPSFVRHDNTLARPYISYTQSDRVDIVLTNPPFGGREEDGIESNFPQHFRTRETADLFLALIVRLLKKDGRASVVLPDGTLFGEGVKTRLKEHLMEECNLHTIVRLPNSVFKPYASIGTNLLFFDKGSPTKDIWFYEHRVPEGQKAYSMTKPIRLEYFQDCIDWWGGKDRKGRVETPLAWKVTAADVKARGYNLDVKNPHLIADDHGDPKMLLSELAAAEAETTILRNQSKAILAEALAR